MTEQQSAPPLLAIFLVSATALAYEVLLVRLFQIVHWHHFAFMIISLALLGYGISGSLITLFRRFCLRHYGLLILLNLLLFGLGSILVYLQVRQIPFNALEILWDRAQWLRLFLTYLLLSLPFLFVANAIALTMLVHDRQIGRIYGADLIGAGVGAVAIMLLLNHFEPATILRLLALTGLAAAIPVLARRPRPLQMAMLFAASALAIVLLPRDWLEPALSEYKGLQQTLLVEGAKPVVTTSDAMSRADVIESPLVPFRHAPGLSLQTPSAPPEQLGVFVDGDAMSVIDRAGNEADGAYLAWMSSALPWQLGRDYGRTLVLNSGTGADVRQAAMLGKGRIDAVEPDAKLTQLHTKIFSGYAGWHSIGDRVTVHEITARAWSASTDERYDLVLLGPPGASTGAAAGVFSFAADFDLTVEALAGYLALLKPDGVLSITSWTDTPPKGDLRLFATAIRALQEQGVEAPEKQIAWIRSWNTATLILRRGELTAGEIAAVRDFSRSRGFDMAWLPGMAPEEANRFQLLPKPYFYAAARALLGEEAQAFIANYEYDIEPVRDGSPYFGDHFRWKSLDDFLALPGRAGIALIDVGYPTLIASLLQALVAAVVLILLPLLFLDRGSDGRGNRTAVMLYFSAIGLAFLFMELSFIEILTLVIGRPLVAVAVTLGVFLLFSGLGSLSVQYLAEKRGVDASVLLRRSVLSILAFALLFILLRQPLTDLLMSLPSTVRIIAAVVLCAPLAFVMGMPFPLGLARTSGVAPELLPWAWGINGCASVLSAILAVLLAMEIGFDGVMLLAAGLYLVAWRVLPRKAAT